MIYKNESLENIIGVDSVQLTSNLNGIGMTSDSILINMSTFLVILAVYLLLIAILFCLLCVK